MHSGFSPPGSDNTVSMNTDQPSISSIDMADTNERTLVVAAPFIMTANTRGEEVTVRSRSCTPRQERRSNSRNRALLPPPGFPNSLGPTPMQQQLTASSAHTHANVMPVQMVATDQIAAQNAQQHVQVLVQPHMTELVNLIGEASQNAALMAHHHVGALAQQHVESLTLQHQAQLHANTQEIRRVAEAAVHAQNVENRNELMNLHEQQVSQSRSLLEARYTQEYQQMVLKFNEENARQTN